MTDTPQPSQEASEAWQDVEQLVINTSVRTSTGRKTWAAIERARAADAQQIAALRAENEQLREAFMVESCEHEITILKAEAQLTALQAEQAQWQPIETAPKDGTSILVWKQGEAVVQGWWNRGDAFNMPHWSTPTNLFDQTHWMPLLQPPLAALTAQQETRK